MVLFMKKAKARFIPILLTVLSALAVSKWVYAQEAENVAADNKPTEELLTIEPEDEFQQFSQHQPISQIEVKYSDMIGFMNSYSAIDKGRVKLSYATIRGSGSSSLLRNLQYLRDIPVSQLSSEDQLAYWLNIRNLMVIFAVTVDGATNLEEERGTYDNPGEMWTVKRIVIGGVNMSIDDIERKIILANWNDPNILYGLYQGVRGGPSLYKPGFRGDTVRDVLPKLGRRYLNSKKVVSVKGAKIELPAVYGWYGDQLFEGDEAALIKHVRRLSKQKLLSKIQKVDTVSLADSDYRIDTTGTIRKTKRREVISAPTPGRGSTGRGGRGAPRRSGS